jgi:hypothetical protein
MRSMPVEKKSGDGQGAQGNPDRNGEARIQNEIGYEGALEIQVAFEKDS